MRNCPKCGHTDDEHQRATTCVRCECAAFADDLGWWEPRQSRYVLTLRDPK